MKKLALLFAAILGLAGQANAQQYGEELTLGSIRGWGWSEKTIVTSDEEIPQLPASVKIPGNWGDVKLYTGSFDANDYTGFKVVLGEAPAEGSVQFYYRNAAQASSYSGTYLPWEEGTVSEDGLTYTGTFSLENLGDDAIITQLALQNRTSSSVTVIINEVYLIDKDGNEVPSNGLSATGWNAASITPLTVPEGGESKDVYEFTSQYGEVGVDFGEVQEIAADQPHIFTLVSSEPIPTGEFQWKIYNEDGTQSYAAWTLESENVVTYTMPANYTGISIQHFVNTTSYLPQDIKLYRKIVGGPIARETLPIKVGSNGSAEIIDPFPSYEQGENGLPIGVEITGSYGAVGLWKEAFEVGEYIGYKVVLEEKPEEGSLQIFFRTETHGNSGGIYLPWETNEANGTVLSEDGTTLTGEFDMDAFEGDNTVLVFAIQKIKDSGSVRCVVKEVYLMNEDDEWVPTPGIGHAASSLWNQGTTFAVGGSYDSSGNIYDAYVKFNAANDYLGTYSGTVDEGTYHLVTFYTEEPLPEGVLPLVMNIGLDWNTWQWTFESIPFSIVDKGENALAVKIPFSYNSLYVGYYGSEENLPCTVRFTKIVREIYEVTPNDYIFSVVGDINGWNSDALMTQSEDNPDVFTVTLTNRQVKEVKEYAFKIRANKSENLFTTENQIWIPEKTGVYTLTYTFNRADNSITVEAVRTDNCTWSVSFANNGNWEKVMVRVMSGDKELANEEATFSRHSSSQDVDLYTWSMKSEDVPTTIIFSDGNDTTTGEMEYVDGKQYDFLTTTGIANVKEEVKDNVIYDMQGRRVAQPGKGLFIINGKKVVLK